jgi:hypothetical protein
MGISLSFFDSPADLVKYIDQELAETNDLLLSHTRKLEGARKKFDAAKREEASKNSKASKPGFLGNAKQLSDIKDFKVLANPSPDYELNLLDEAIKTAQEKIGTLEKAKKQVIPALRNSLKITAIFDNQVLIAFMYHDESKN